MDTNLRIRPLLTVVFIFSTKCSTFALLRNKPQYEKWEVAKMHTGGSTAWSVYLQIPNTEFVLIDICSVRTCSEAGHGGQVTTVTAHSLNDEHTALSSSRWLLDPVTGLHKHTHRNKWARLSCIFEVVLRNSSPGLPKALLFRNGFVTYV